MAFNFQASTVFSGTDQISQAIGRAQKNTAAASGKMGKSLDNTGKRADSLKTKIGSIGDIAKGVAIGSLVAKGITAAAQQVKGLINSIGEYADRVDNIRTSAQKIGLGAQEFQKLSWAAESNNVSVDKLQSGFLNLNKSLGSGALMKHLSEVDKGLAAQVKQAKTNTEIFSLMAGAIAKENDIAKRAALGASAFGKSWADLYPLLSQGAEGIKAAGDAIPHLISDREIAASKLFNSTVFEMKKNIQGFADVIRSAVVQHVGPYVLAIKTWVENNRELIKQKIAEAVQKAVVFFKRAAGVIQEIIMKVQKAIQFFKKWRPIILAVGVAVGVLWGIVSAVIAIKNAIMMVKSAFAILNAVLSANPIGIIIIAVAALIAGFVLLAKKVGGVVPALEVVGQTLMKSVLTPFNLLLDAIQFLLPMGARIGVVIAESFKAAGQSVLKYLLTPINLVISGIGGLLGAIGKIPGADWAKTATDEIKVFQDKMNTMMTGSESTLLNSGAAALLDPAKAAKNTMADKIAAAEAAAMSGVTGIQNFQDKMNTTLTGGTGTLYGGAINGAVQGYQNGGISGAIKGTVGGAAGVVSESYDAHRSAYLAAHPEEAPGVKTDNAEDKWNSMLGKMDEMIKAQGATTGAVTDLKDTGGKSPAALKWGAMGQDDFWETVALGT